MKKKQSGASMIGMMVVLLLGVAILTLAFKLLPLYMDNWTISKALEQVAQSENAERLSDREIVSKVQNQLTVNGVRNFDTKHLVVTRDKGRMHLVADYEVRTPIVKNIDAIVSFKNRFEIAAKSD